MSVKIDRMRFQPNNFSYNLGLLAFLIYIVYIGSTLDYIPKKLTLGMEVMIDLGFFMVLVLGMEKVKNYSVQWSVYLILLGISCLLRYFWHPMVLKSLNFDDVALVSGVSILVSGILIIIGGVVGYIRSSILMKYLKETGLTMDSIDDSHNPDGSKK